GTSGSSSTGMAVFSIALSEQPIGTSRYDNAHVAKPACSRLLRGAQAAHELTRVTVPGASVLRPNASVESAPWRSFTPPVRRPADAGQSAVRLDRRYRTDDMLRHRQRGRSARG